jgi:hypothetical protein
MVLAMLGMMRSTVTDAELQRFVHDAATGRQRELDKLHVWQGEVEVAAVGSPGASSGAGAVIGSYDIYFEPRKLTIPAETHVIVTLPNELVGTHIAQ